MIDIILLLLMAAYSVSGYRQGFLISASSLVGFLGCGALAMWVLPDVLGRWLQGPSDLRSSLILVGGVLTCAALGQGVFGALGARVKNRVRFAPAHMVDAALGAVASLVAICLLTWFVAGAVRGVAGPVSRQIGRSHIVAALDDLIPARAAELFTGFRSLLDRGGFPKVFESLGPERILPIDPPDGAVAQSKAVRDAARSIVKVTGVARSCSRSQEGSGWVVAPDKVVTNAHVVAGERSQVVRIGGTGTAYEAHVVLFDPKRDIAVLDVPGLPAPPLKLGPDAVRGTSAVVAGFPENGPYTVGAARVRQVIDATGNDIYDRPGIERQVYSLYARVRPGNSGGPLLGTGGKVIGIVFATSLDDPNTGYALTMHEAAPILERAAGANTPVRTGGCATG
ncbi:MAG: MarP family serine protease [Actinomycetales bacterium]